MTERCRYTAEAEGRLWSKVVHRECHPKTDGDEEFQKWWEGHDRTREGTSFFERRHQQRG